MVLKVFQGSIYVTLFLKNLNLYIRKFRKYVAGMEKAAVECEMARERFRYC